ncbi:MAG: hypothetical protein R3B54_06990 [Bdellovibrionota bacterium]
MGGAFRSTVQLYTHRSTADTIRLGNPFGSYGVKGFLAQDKGDTCISDPGSRMCIWSRFYAASYNFYKQKVLLYGRNFNLNCDVQSDGLTCGECKLSRVSKETAAPRKLVPDQRKAFFETSLNPESRL